MHSWQIEILRAFDERVARFFLLRWHRRARKTTLLLNLLIRECATYKNRVYGYIAPTYKQAKSIIWRDPNMINHWLPPEIVKRKNESELFVEFNTGSILTLRGGDDPDSIRGADFHGVVIDEWAMIKLMVWEEILRPIITQNNDRWAMFAFTPKGQNHAFDYWNKAKQWGDWYRAYLPSSQSRLVPEAELLKAKRQMPPALYEQEFECSFLAEDEFTLISPEAIERLKGAFYDPLRMRKIISCDPATGGDECVAYVFENHRMVEQKIMYHRDTMKIVGELMILSNKHKADDIAVDIIGIGKGIADRLGEMGKKVIYINSAAEAEDKERFYNVRAEMWWYVNDLIQSCEMPYIEDTELRRQLCSVKYEIVSSNGKFKLEPKAETKKRLERSPDRADAFVYGLWGLRQVQETAENYTGMINKKRIFSGAGAW